MYRTYARDCVVVVVEVEIVVVVEVEIVVVVEVGIVVVVVVYMGGDGRTCGTVAVIKVVVCGGTWSRSLSNTISTLRETRKYLSH